MDIDIQSRSIVQAGLAFDTIYNRSGKTVTTARDLTFSGIQRLCSAKGFKNGKDGFVDDIFVTGEETFSGGSAFALDIKNSEVWAVPALGRAGFESFTSVGLGDSQKVSLLIGDDCDGAGLLLYIGEKMGTDFLSRNRLKHGKLYAWKPDQSGIRSPNDWTGTGNTLQGQFIEIEYFRPDLKGNGDELGYAQQGKQDALVAAAGAFKF